MKKFLILSLILGLLSLPVFADTVDNSMSFSVPGIPVIKVNPELVTAPSIDFNVIETPAQEVPWLIIASAITGSALLCLIMTDRGF